MTFAPGAFSRTPSSCLCTRAQLELTFPRPRRPRRRARRVDLGLALAQHVALALHLRVPPLLQRPVRLCAPTPPSPAPPCTISRARLTPPHLLLAPLLPSTSRPLHLLAAPSTAGSLSRSPSSPTRGPRSAPRSGATRRGERRRSRRGRAARAARRRSIEGALHRRAWCTYSMAREERVRCAHEQRAS